MASPSYSMCVCSEGKMDVLSFTILTDVEIQELDSNMQYLVYENHSKFIKASETIREVRDDGITNCLPAFYTSKHPHNCCPLCSQSHAQMKDDFQRLEDDMSHLGSRMDEITASSTSINRALVERKREISKLCGVHHLLKKVCEATFSSAYCCERNRECD